MAKSYSESDLKYIGKQCGNRLPPASAIQAMFLYEMQRESELERLFHGHMFELARLDDSSKTQQDQVSGFSEELKDLRDNIGKQIQDIRKEVTAENIQKRVSTSLVRIDALQRELSQCDGRIDDQAAQVTAMQTRVDELSASLTADQEGNARLVSLDEDITVLFEERDAMFELVGKATKRIDNLEKDVTRLFEMVSFSNEAIVTTNEAVRNNQAASAAREKEQNDRIQKLEDLVRVLTAQSPSSSSSASQRLELHAANGQCLDLAVQKGSSFVPYNKKENIRSFTPGKQWM